MSAHQFYHHHNQWNGGQRDAALLCAQDQKRFAEAGQRKDGTHANHLPTGGQQAGKTGAPDEILPDAPRQRLWLLHPERQQGYSHGTGDDRNPEHRLKKFLTTKASPPPQ